MARAGAKAIALATLFYGSASAAPPEKPEKPADKTTSEKTSEEAKEHYIRGRREFDLGKYEVAISEYQIAYNLKNDPTYSWQNHVRFDPATEAQGRSLQAGAIACYVAGGVIAVVGVVAIALGMRSRGQPATIARSALRWSF